VGVIVEREHTLCNVGYEWSLPIRVLHPKTAVLVGSSSNALASIYYMPILNLSWGNNYTDGGFS
jgi:hypothetical protein